MEMQIQLHDEFVICNTGKSMNDAIPSYNPIKNKNYYDNFFYANSHWIWVYCHIENSNSNSNGNGECNYSFICVLKNPDYTIDNFIKKYVHLAVLIDKDGQKLFNLIANNSTRQHIESFFLNKFQCYRVKRKLAKELVPNIELKYSNAVSKLTVGVLRIKTSQTTRKEWLNNGTSKDFLKFVRRLGKKINLNNWHGHKGDMNDKTTIYNHWKGLIPTIYHICPCLSKDDRRQLIGNDLLLIMYIDDNDGNIDNMNDAENIDVITNANTSANAISLNLSNLNELGKMPQCVALIKRDGSKYLLKIIIRKNVPNKFRYRFTKPLSFDEMEEIMLTAFYNTMNYLHKHDIFKDMFKKPRQMYINSIAESFELKKKHSPSNDDKCTKQLTNDSLLVARTKSQIKLGSMFKDRHLFMK